jgi:hypothetical protein
MQNAEAFVLRDRSVVCPDCQSIFGTRVLQDLPPVCDSDIVEADLHRVLPHAGLRAALVTVCPDCGYADWVAKFGVSIIAPTLLPPSPALTPTKRFAMAVKHARKQGLHPLDIAYVALNGLYAARESGENDVPWLELCAFEQSRGLEPENLVVETGSDHLTMAELWRQMGHFDRALDEYAKSGMDGTVPIELIRQQEQSARVGDSTATRLSPWMVRLIFPDAAELSVSPDADAMRIAPIIIQESNRLSHLAVDENGKLAISAESNPPGWAINGQFDLPVEAILEDDGTAFEETPEQAEQLRNIAELERIMSTGIIESPDVVQEVVPTSPVLNEPLVVPIEAAPVPIETAPAPIEIASVPIQATPVPIQAAPAVAAIHVEPALEQNAPASIEPIPAPALMPAAQISPPPAQTDVSPAPVKALQSAPTTQQETPATAVEGVSLARVKQIIAMPHAASSVNLVQSGDGSSISIAISPSAVVKAAAKALEKEPRVPDYFGGAKDPQTEEDKDPTHKAFKRALKAGKKGKKQEAPKLPEVHLYEEESYGYDDDDDCNDDESAQSGITAAAAAAHSAPPADKSPQDAVAQVESFLSLTRQPSYQNWIRGYRR